MFLFLIIVLFALFHVLNAFYVKKQRSPFPKVATEYKKMALIIPCYNEEIILKSILRSLTKQNYPGLEIILINDGSSDHSMAILKKDLALTKIPNRTGELECKCILDTYASTAYPNMFVIDKENGGKADSLNAGINFTEQDYVVTLDADSILKDDALYEINHSLNKSDVIAVGGNVVVAQGVLNYNGDIISAKPKSKLLEYCQFIEYLRGFFVLKNSYAHLNALSVISGAFGVFDKKVMLEVGGFVDTIGEDMDITIKFNKYALEHKKKILFNDEALCFTEVPNNWYNLKKQRIRWQKGFLDTLKNHFGFFIRNILSNKLSFFVIVESTFLMYYSTLITIFGQLYVVHTLFSRKPIDTHVLLMLLIGIFIYIYTNYVTIRLARDVNFSFKDVKFSFVLLLCIYEFVIYRPLMIMIILYGSIEYIFKPSGWNKVSRIGVSDSMVDSEEEVAV